MSNLTTTRINSPVLRIKDVEYIPSFYNLTAASGTYVGGGKILVEKSVFSI